jgi:hypothetical protein
MKRMKTKLTLHMIILFSFMAFASVESQAGNERTSARLVGMAQTKTAMARGMDAIGVNPALLSIPHRSSVEINILPVGVRVGSNFLDLDLYGMYFTGVEDPVAGGRVAKHLTPQDKEDLLSRFPDGYGSIFMDAQVMWLGFSMRTSSHGGVGLSVSDRVSGRFTLPNDYLRMLLYGFSENGSTYDFSGTDAKAWWLREYAVAYSTPQMKLFAFLPWLSLGGGIKYVEGFSYFGTESYAGTISNGGFDERFRLSGELTMVSHRAAADFLANSDEHSFNPVGSPAGKGLGFDAGIALGLLNNVVVGLSVTDIGSIRWTENTYSSTGEAKIQIDDIFSTEQMDSLRDAYKGNDEPIGSFSTSLPTAFRAGVSWDVYSLLSLGADYTVGFNDMPGNSTTPRIAIGGEWRFMRNLPLRTGVAFGGYEGFTWAVGLGMYILFMDLEFATENVGLFAYGQKCKQVSLTANAKIRF